MKLLFDPPLVHEGSSCADMLLREPTGGNVLRAEKALASETGAQARRVRDGTLIAAVAGVDIALVRKMPASTFKAAAAFLNAFDAPLDVETARDTGPELTLALPAKIEEMGRIVDQLELREPTTGEVEEAQRRMTETTTAAMRAMQQHLIALVADYPRPVIERVPISILNRASRYLLGFT